MSDCCVSGNQIMENEHIRDFHKCQNWQYCHNNKKLYKAIKSFLQWDKIRCQLNS